MSTRGVNQSHLIVGALLGSLAASASYLLFTTKRGEIIRESATDGIKTIKNKLEDFIESTVEQGEYAASEIVEKTDEYGDKVKDFLLYIGDQLENLKDRDGKEKLMLLLAGGIIGALLAAGAGSLLSDARGKDGHFHITDFASYASSLRDALNSNEGRKLQKKTTSICPEKMNEYLDLALSGLALWQKLQKR